MAIPVGFVQQAAIKAYYKLDDVNDSSIGAHNLTNNGTCTFTAAYIGNGVNLGSSNSSKYLSIADNLDISGGACTLMCVVKNLAEIGSGTFSFVSLQSATSNVMYMLAYSYNGGTRQLAFERWKQGTAVQSTTYNITMGTTNNYFLALTYNTTNIIGYSAGVEVAAPVAASGNGGSAVANITCIGLDGGLSAGWYASSLVDEVVIWNVALSAAEVLTQYQYTLRKYNSGGAFLLNFI